MGSSGTVVRLRVGAAVVDITPQWPVALAGFASRSGVFSGVRDPLHLRVLLLETEGAEGTQRGLVVSADLLWWGPERVPELKRLLARTARVDEALILLASTHNHSGPMVSESFASSLGCPDRRYLEWLDQRLMEGVGAAGRDLDEVTLERGSARFPFGVSRRKVVDGVVRSLPNTRAKSDPELSVVAFRDFRGRPKAVIAHYACHPVLAADDFVTGEYPGVGMSLLEQGKVEAALFLQGCAGDINPAVTRDGHFFRAGHDGVSRYGSRLAEFVAQVLDGSMERLRPRPLQARCATASLPFHRLPDEAMLHEALAAGGAKGEWATTMLAHPSRLRSSATLHLQLIDVADNLSFLAFSAEMCVAYGLFVKRLSSGRILPVGYSNGMVGYVPTARQISQGGYEPEGSIWHFLLPGRFSTSIEKRVRAAINELVGAPPPVADPAGRVPATTPLPPPAPGRLPPCFRDSVSDGDG